MGNENIKAKEQDASSNKDALINALQDIEQDVDLSPIPDRTADLDEGELARFDNSNEKAFDALESDEPIKKDENDKP